MKTVRLANELMSGIAAAAGQAQFGVEIVADAGGVDIAVLIHFSAAQKTEIDVAALGDAEGVVQAG